MFNKTKINEPNNLKEKLHWETVTFKENLIFEFRSGDYENRAGMGERRRTQADSERNSERCKMNIFLQNLLKPYNIVKNQQNQNLKTTIYERTI